MERKRDVGALKVTAEPLEGARGRSWRAGTSTRTQPNPSEKGEKMESEALVKLALRARSCSQRDLATILEVSPTQISKWKNGEQMSPVRAQQLRCLSEIGDEDATFVLLAGSLADAKKWEKLLDHLASVTCDVADQNDPDLLSGDLSVLGRRTFCVLRAMGVALPSKFPEELDFSYDSASLDNSQNDLRTRLDANPHSLLIAEIYQSLNDLYRFHSMFTSDTTENDLKFDATLEGNIRSGLMNLAAANIDVDRGFATKILHFRYHTINYFRRWLQTVMATHHRARIPLRVRWDPFHRQHPVDGFRNQC
jgi:transcriptional regulator with XRE-family HTH domain